MCLKHVATAVLMAVVLMSPTFANTALPRVQPAAPVFVKFAVRDKLTVCNSYADFGATIAETVQSTLIDPLVAIADSFAVLFHPFFADALAEDRQKYRTSVNRRPSLQSPSRLVREAGLRRLCG